MILRFSWIAIFLFSQAVAVNTDEVSTKYGKVVGSEYLCKYGTKVNAFLGIPFAKPPVGELRFEKPVTPDPWNNTLFTTKYAPACVVYLQCESSEDCLYLNILSPAAKNPNGYPVVVFIHGGGYSGGSANEFNPNHFSEIYVRRGIVIATIQYRLGFFGFMSTNTSDLRGNYGMWDQTLALRFIKQNVAAFGGNPNQITIWGESAGASSVGHHTLVPQSRGLFSQSFQMSGSSFSDFAIGHHTMNTTKKIATLMGCTDEQQVKSCLRNKTVEEFWKAAKIVGNVDDINPLPLTPLFDGDFYPKQVEFLIDDAPRIPSMFGLNMVEGRAFIYKQFELPSYFSYTIAMEDIPKFNETVFVNFVNKFVINEKYGVNRSQAFDDYMGFVRSRMPNNADYRFWNEEFVQVVGDSMLNVPTIREAEAKLKAGFPVYALKLDYSNPGSWPVSLPAQGSTHCGEFPYVFEEHIFFNITFADRVVEHIIQEALIPFFKNGVPQPEDVNWVPFGENHEYFSVKPNPVMTHDFFGDSYRFWTDYMRKYGGWIQKQ